MILVVKTVHDIDDGPWSQMDSIDFTSPPLEYHERLFRLWLPPSFAQIPGLVLTLELPIYFATQTEKAH